MKIFLSPLAEKKIHTILEFIEEKWSIKSKEDFFSQLLKKFDFISRQPKGSIRVEEYPNLYKCIVTRQTSFFYRIHSDEIEVITVVDNRQDPKIIDEEIKKFFV